MPVSDEFRYVYEELRVFARNLGKDNTERRTDIRVIERNICKLNRINNDFVKIEVTKEQEESEQVVKYKQHISQQLSEIQAVLVDRQSKAKRVRIDDSSSNKNLELIVKMGDKFDLKVASTLLPAMNGNENVTKQLIDAIELYDELLNPEGKKLLTTYVLKTKITQAAKLRLNSVYEANADLIVDLRRNFITKQAASAISIEIHNARQGQKSVEDYGQTIESLMVNLTLSQANGDEAIARVLSKTNEKIAIASFANGLRDPELKTLIKARNFETLQAAIVAAKDEECSKRSSSSHVFAMNRRGGFRYPMSRPFNRQTHAPRDFSQNNSNNRYQQSRNFNPGNNYNQSSRNFNARNTPSSRGYYSGSPRGQYGSRTRGRGNYFFTSSGASHNSGPSDTFFRAPLQ